MGDNSDENNARIIQRAFHIAKYTRPQHTKYIESFARRLKDALRMYRAWSLILVRLPANDLVFYKLVCKLWQCLISSSSFMSAHFKHSISNPSSHCLLLHENYPEFRVYTPFGPFMYCIAPTVAMVGSVNGLICVVANYPFWKLSGDGIWIFNPVIGHMMKLPVPFESPFDRHTESFAVVFWWDSITGNDGDGEYKLAKIVSKPDNTTVASLWVSSSPETWSEIPVGFSGSFYNRPFLVSGCDIVLGDIAYWIVFKLIDGRDVGDLFVLSLNLKTLSLSLNENPFPLNITELNLKTPLSPNEDPSPLNILEPTDCVRLGFKDNFLWAPDNSLLFAANWKGSFALVEKDEKNKRYNVWTVDDDVEGGWSIASYFAEEFHIERCINSINGKSIFLRVVRRKHIGVKQTRRQYTGREHIGISLFDVGTGEGELIECYRSSEFVTSAHDFVGSFVSIKGFKPSEAYGINQVPHIRISWPSASPCKISTNYYLIPGYDRKSEYESETESETESENDN